jgi:hypothetical protein
METDGPDFLVTYETIASLVLPPLYSIGDPFLKNFNVGNPLIPNLSPSVLA